MVKILNSSFWFLSFKLARGCSSFLRSQSLTVPSCDPLMNMFSIWELNLTWEIHLECPSYWCTICFVGLFSPLRTSQRRTQESSLPERIKWPWEVSMLVGTLLSVWMTCLIRNDFSMSTILMAWSLHPATRLSPSSHESATTPPFTCMLYLGLKVETSVFYLFKDPSACAFLLNKDCSSSFHICTDAKSSSTSSASLRT